MKADRTPKRNRQICNNTCRLQQNKQMENQQGYRPYHCKQHDLMDTYGTHHPTAEYTPSFQGHLEPSPIQTIFGGTPSKLFYKIKVMQSMFSEHNEIKLEISNRKILRKPPNIWKLNNIQMYKVLRGRGEVKGLISTTWAKAMVTREISCRRW